MIITLTGTPGSGKSALGRALAEELNYEFVSMGDITREIAKKKGMNIHDFTEWAKKNDKTDREVDEYVINLGSKDKIIVDGRLAWHFIPKSFKIWVTAEEKVRAERIFNAERGHDNLSSTKEVMAKNEKRLSADISRYKKLYQIEDYTAQENFDFILDTTKLSIEEEVKIIIAELEKT